MAHHEEHVAAAGLSPAGVLLAAGDEVVRADRAGVLTEARFLSLVGFSLAGREGDGADAVELVSALHPDLVVLDVAVAGAHGPRARPPSPWLRLSLSKSEMSSV